MAHYAGLEHSRSAAGWIPESLDHGLLLRAVGVRRDGKAVIGDVRIEGHETRWIRRRATTGCRGHYELIALSILEDLAGNRIGRAFEIDSFDRTDKEAESVITSIPFSLASNSH